MDRRSFFRSSCAGMTLLPLAATLPVHAGSAQHAEQARIDKAVVLVGDDIPRGSSATLARLTTLVAARDKVGDAYLARGVVDELEHRFATLLGKQDAAFIPTGTLANQIALRLLCGEKRRALVQQESHIYRDESDAVTTLSAINLVPLAPGRAAPTIEEVTKAIEISETSAYALPIGAIALESPVRRADGAMVPYAVAEAISRLGKSKGMGLHLDGARLLLNAGAEGFSPQRYSALFDTVYVSLYKYLGALFGGILAGDKATIDRARALRHLFGGTIYHGWPAALLALDALDGFEQRFAQVRRAGDKLLTALAAIPGFAVERVENGTNIHFLRVPPERQHDLADQLHKADVMIGRLDGNRLALNFNETLLRRPIEAVAKAFAS
jgi:threonine aldolase